MASLDFPDMMAASDAYDSIFCTELTIKYFNKVF